MVEKICCRIISQIPLIKYSKLGIIVRIQASKFISENDQINSVFDIYVDELVPSKSNIFFDISVNNGQGDLVLLTSESCCVVAVIPWNRNIESFQRMNKIYNSRCTSSSGSGSGSCSSSNYNSNSSSSSSSSSSSASTSNTNSNSSSNPNPNSSSSSSSNFNFQPESRFNSDYSTNNTGHGQQGLKIKRPSHAYGIFEENDLELFDNSDKPVINNTHNHKSQTNDETKQDTVVYEIPLVTGIIILNFFNIQTKDNGLYTVKNNKTYIIKSLWYHLDDYIVFILTKTKNKSPKLIALDLISIINNNEELNSKISYNKQFQSFIGNSTYIDDIGNTLISEDNNYICNYFDLKFNNNNNNNFGFDYNPVDFVFGRGPDVWNILTIYVLFEENIILTLCPVIMNRMKLPYFAYQLLYTTLLEQEFLLNSKEEMMKKDFHYDENLHNTLNIVLGDLRNPIDECGNIIEKVLYVDIPKETFLIISSILKPIPIKLKIIWECEKENNIKSGKLISITNYPLSVFAILGSNLEIGLFISSYLSLPNYEDTYNYNRIQNIKDEKEEEEEDTEYDFNLILKCIQKSKIPQNFLKYGNKKKNNQEIGGYIENNVDNGDEDENGDGDGDEITKKIISRFKFYDGLYFSSNKNNFETEKTINDEKNNIYKNFGIEKNYVKKDLNNSDTYQVTNYLNSNNDQPLFVIGISMENNIYIIYIDWLHYLFTLYSTIESDIYDDDNNKVLPVYENIEVIRKCINSNQELKIIPLNNNDNINLKNTNLSFNSYYGINNKDKKNINRNKVYIEFIYNLNKYVNIDTNININTDINNNKFDYILCNPDYDELPEMSCNEVYNIKSIRKEFNISDFINEDLSRNSGIEMKKNDDNYDDDDNNKNKNNNNNNNNNNSLITEIDYQVNKLNEYTQESLLIEMKNYNEKFNLLKNDLKSLNNEQEISEYYLKVLKFLNDYNSNILVKLNSSTKPILNMVDNIKPRINLMEELKDDIEKTNEKIKQKEEEIQNKIQSTLEMNNNINKRISKIKKLFLQELNNQRIQYNQDVILPELLLMLSNVQLELCSTILNTFNNNNDILINNLNVSGNGNGNGNNNHTGNNEDCDMLKVNIFTNEFNNYVNYNKFVISKFQNLQNKVLELNRIVCNYSK
ncbi:uncharacterized protein cubi_01714 [Cryptosporidium ubiquitum]|uniref:SPX domain-containing protein n=1 Tax=Cryptosporidium ubiquitum TaxID=857276 RepID=A0A1J4MB79_9CRYT|nr:uncharacterized protein cubi_01714 [Cryptosporidium ubiquitum]OII71239.1 hypothetical protein cubi_01714 [Cryptosporidium ubiquitum]